LHHKETIIPLLEKGKTVIVDGCDITNAYQTTEKFPFGHIHRLNDSQKVLLPGHNIDSKILFLTAPFNVLANREQGKEKGKGRGEYSLGKEVEIAEKLEKARQWYEDNFPDNIITIGNYGEPIEDFKKQMEQFYPILNMAYNLYLSPMGIEIKEEINFNLETLLKNEEYIKHFQKKGTDGLHRITIN
jgi:thymidylate kinase